MQVLKDFHAVRQLEAAANGWTEFPAWLFCDKNGKPFFHNYLRNTFHRLTKPAKVRRIRAFTTCGTPLPRYCCSRAKAWST